MSEIYSDQHRQFQDKFDSRKMADRLEEIIVKSEIDETLIPFLESRDMFFLSTVGPDGQPTVSYKGGEKGLIKIVDATTIAFPSYDGNGMFMSVGNMAANSKIGLLFIDFETPHRVRLHGEASISDDDPLLANYPEADLIIRVKISKLWVNCPRYIHRHKKIETSQYVPKEECETPIAQWKRIDVVQDVLPKRDEHAAQKTGGTISVEEYQEKIMKGEG